MCVFFPSLSSTKKNKADAATKRLSFASTMESTPYNTDAEDGYDGGFDDDMDAGVSNLFVALQSGHDGDG